MRPVYDKADTHFDCRIMVNGNVYDLAYDVSIYEKDPDEGGGLYYGVRVNQSPGDLCCAETGAYMGETMEVTGFTEDLGEAGHFLRMLAEGSVQPMSLLEVVDDWRCAFRDDE